MIPDHLGCPNREEFVDVQDSAGVVCLILVLMVKVCAPTNTEPYGSYLAHRDGDADTRPSLRSKTWASWRRIQPGWKADSCKHMGDYLLCRQCFKSLGCVERNRNRHSCAVTRATRTVARFSHDGRLAATVSVDGTARLWDSVTRKAARCPWGRDGRPASYKCSQMSGIRRSNSAFSRDDRLLATASVDGGVRVWNVESGSPLTALSGHQLLVEHLEFSPADNTLLLTASHDGTARLWDVDGILTSELFHEYPPDICGLQPGQRAPCDGRRKSGGASVGCRQQP